MNEANLLKIPNINISLVTHLIEKQFPEWAHLSIEPVEKDGWDNRTFRLGQKMSIRLPSAQQYEVQVAKEQKWLPTLAAHLSYPIPRPIALGKAITEYPLAWSIYSWLEGRSANLLPIHEPILSDLAIDSAQFLRELHMIDISGGPIPGMHNFHRGGSLLVYDEESKSSILHLKDVIDSNAARKIWERALTSEWNKDPVWVHGDLSAGNILIQDSKLAAIIDFGCMCIGDPACDLVIAWTLFTGESRSIFKANLPFDNSTWYRAQGWALWKALITLASLKDYASNEALKQRNIIYDLIHEL